MGNAAPTWRTLIGTSVASFRTVLRFLRLVINDRSGATALIYAVALPGLVGVTGVGVEISNWYMTKRSMQNAADSAVLAAAANEQCDGYRVEYRSLSFRR